MYILKGEHQEIDPQACGQKQFRNSGGCWDFPTVTRYFENFQQNKFCKKRKVHSPAAMVNMVINEENKK